MDKVAFYEEVILGEVFEKKASQFYDKTAHKRAEYKKNILEGRLAQRAAEAHNKKAKMEAAGIGLGATAFLSAAPAAATYGITSAIKKNHERKAEFANTEKEKEYHNKRAQDWKKYRRIGTTISTIPGVMYGTLAGINDYSDNKKTPQSFYKEKVAMCEE